jgi:MFS family permease
MSPFYNGATRHGMRSFPNSFLAIGPVDAAIMVAITAFALVLPLDVTGLFLLRLARDLEHVGVESEFERYEHDVRHALQSAGPTLGEPVAGPTTLEAVHNRRTAFALMYSFGILGLSSVLTLVGMSAALWHMAWWVAAAFAVMVLVSLVIVSIAVATAQPPDSPAERERMRRYGKELARRARAQAQKDKELAKQARAQTQDNNEHA